MHGNIIGASKLARDITDRKRLESEILEVSDREQRRIGHDLHDGLCQHLAGIEMMSQVLAKKLAGAVQGRRARAGDIARACARSHQPDARAGARPVPGHLGIGGPASALHELAGNMEKMFGMRCHFDCDSQCRFDDHAMATHLFRLAQEAVSNAIKHGQATNITIHLKADPGRIYLGISDDGSGFARGIPTSNGMGLRIMQIPRPA